jgi:mono/diheme cytochrome c family protein
MRPRENFAPFIVVTLALTLAILAVFQIYIWREPARIETVEAADLSAAQAAGRQLYADDCAACHGDNGEGQVGPALNSRELLKTTMDATLHSLIRTGVPGSVMPAWGQAFGGPLTDEQVNQLVAFIRAWEPTAPELVPISAEPDPVRGAVIFASTCFICHGDRGQGADHAPALNDPVRLKEFDDTWYRNTIAHGRPAKGMPTWGTVLSPAEINDLVALIGAWREGKTVTAVVPLARHLSSALFALRQFDKIDAVFHLSAALTQANRSQAIDIEAAIDLIKGNHLSEAQTRLIAVLPPEEMGKELYESNCAPCHGADGTGGLGKNLHTNKFIQSKSDEELIEFLLTGRQGTAMDGFDGILTPEELNNVVALIRAWQK